eukprot:GHUV01040725.1.p1 GENE.GHUV01040725.1~~GHUV01040725.1.p1  ORF type:complete len:133 (-),score=24.11 GHUV01040725.1:94-492(-)
MLTVVPRHPSLMINVVALQAPQIEYVKAFTRRQHELGIYGTVGEIGVHHGKFLIPILGNALASEPAIAMDLFEDQESNLAKSGERSGVMCWHGGGRRGEGRAQGEYAVDGLAHHPAGCEAAPQLVCRSGGCL